jgi:hypothetical protein
VGRLVLAIVIFGACAKSTGDQPAIDSPPEVDMPATGDAPPDMPNGCATQPCSIVPQCGCASTDSCDIDFSDFMGSACRLISAAGRETASCNQASKCDRGYACVGGSQATCKKYCSADAECGSPRGQCVIDITNAGQPLAGIPPVCSSNCDPVATGTTFCPTNFKCIIRITNHLGTPRNITDCAPAGAGGQGASCQSGAGGADSLCAPDFSCTSLNGGSTFNCRHYCSSANPTCPGGTSCIPFNPTFVIAGVQYGVCN